MFHAQLVALHHHTRTVERAQGSYASAFRKSPVLIFAIGALDKGQFRLFHWKQNTGDEDEVMLGTIHLTNGRDFLVTSVTNPEDNGFAFTAFRKASRQWSIRAVVRVAD